MGGPDLEVRAFRSGDTDAVVSLWKRCGLVVWYNDPVEDLQRFEETPTAAVFVGCHADRLVASTCAGYDGHRGWLYFVAVDPDCQGCGFGRLLVRHAEDWLRALGAPKVELIVRESNLEVGDFYRGLGYDRSPCVIYQRWLRDPAGGR
jgi:ribosomal protein S18 acetylase RimI-like enzyme